MNKATLLGLILLVSAVPGFSIFEKLPFSRTPIQPVNDDKVRVQLFFESLCPGCQ